MSDVFSKEKRSEVMSKIRSKDTMPELVVRKFLFSKGFRYRIHDRKLPGTPDIVLPRLKTAIFVHGCFWHGHRDCKFFCIPKTNTEWWVKKIERNKFLDRKHKRDLRKLGVNVISIFECQLKGKKKVGRLTQLLNELTMIKQTLL